MISDCCVLSFGGAWIGPGFRAFKMIFHIRLSAEISVSRFACLSLGSSLMEIDWKLTND